MNENKQVYVAFADKKLETNFEALKAGMFEDRQLFGSIERAISDLKQNPMCGTRIQKRLWPIIYTRKYGITNLWKYDLPNAWRLVYTIRTDEVMILNIILEWFNHKEYEKRFGY
jgi:Txe/YoeB family toxin of Txe-Axe toxin-antitoxin module